MDSTPGFNGLGKDNCKTKRETFQVWDMVCLILEIWRYMFLFPLINLARKELRSYRINVSLSSTRKDLNWLCHLNVEKVYKIQIYSYVSREKKPRVNDLIYVFMIGYSLWNCIQRDSCFVFYQTFYMLITWIVPLADWCSWDIHILNAVPVKTFGQTGLSLNLAWFSWF